ncbi:hypothetical protein BH09BAC6_BH09BAC6_32250 [soil metagenome]|jgi:hypothetical protein
MKTFILIVLAFVCMASCKKSSPLSPGVFGKWEVRRVYNGNIYPPDSLFKPGNGNVLQLNADSTYIRHEYLYGSATGVFHIRKNGYKIDQKLYDVMYFGTDTFYKTVIRLNGDRMTEDPLMPDLPTVDYQKISQ